MLVVINLDLLKRANQFFWCKGKQVSSDYHSEMNTELFTNWFISNFINYLEQGSVIVMDNATHHSAIMNEAPSTNLSLKMLTGSKKKKIAAHPTESRVELLQCVQPLKMCNIYIYMNGIKFLMNSIVRLYDYHHTIVRKFHRINMGIGKERNF